MKSLVKKIVIAYVVIKVVPPIFKVVAYITEGAVQGVANKIVKDIFSTNETEEGKRKRRNLRYNSYLKGKA